MNIGEAAKASHISAKMIRYYEQIGLTPPADRSEAGYRSYGRADVHRLHFIRRARDLGFSVAGIGVLLELRGDPMRQSADVKRVAERHIAELEQRMERMRQMAACLKALIGGCAGDGRPDCSILDGLQQPDDGACAPKPPGGAITCSSRFQAAQATHGCDCRH